MVSGFKIIGQTPQDTEDSLQCEGQDNEDKEENHKITIRGPVKTCSWEFRGTLSGMNIDCFLERWHMTWALKAWEHFTRKYETGAFWPGGRHKAPNRDPLKYVSENSSSGFFFSQFITKKEKGYSFEVRVFLQCYVSLHIFKVQVSFEDTALKLL